MPFKRDRWPDEGQRGTTLSQFLARLSRPRLTRDHCDSCGAAEVRLPERGGDYRCVYCWNQRPDPVFV